MADVKISQLPAATQSNATDELAANQAGTTRKVTADQISEFVGTDILLRGTLAARPVAGVSGRLYYAKDQGVLYRDNGFAWESIKGAKSGVWASEFASTGSGTDADPWPIQAIIDAIDYVIATDTQDPGRCVYLDAGIFRGTTPINFNVGTKNLSGLKLQGMGMGSPGDITPIGRNTLIDFQPGVGNTLPAIFFGHTDIQTNRIIMQDFAVKANGNAIGVIKWHKVFTSSMRNIFTWGNTKDDPDNWAFWGLDSFSGQFDSLYFYNCYRGFNLDHTSNNGFQADIGFIEVNGFVISEGANPRIGCRFRGLLSAVKINVMIVGFSGANSIGCLFTSCKGVTAQPYVEGFGATGFTNIGIQVDNCRSVVLTSPTVTRITTRGIYGFANLNAPVLLGPQFGADSGNVSPATAVFGSFVVIEPVFVSDWTGPRHNNGFAVWLDQAQLGGWVNTFANGATTPSVRRTRLNRTANTAATTITQFIEGETGQEIIIRAGDALTTIQHGTNIFLKGGANKTLVLNETILLAQWTTDRWDEI